MRKFDGFLNVKVFLQMAVNNKMQGTQNAAPLISSVVKYMKRKVWIHELNGKKDKDIR
jgi:hypothetical protein